jgi:hypothetical protein
MRFALFVVTYKNDDILLRCLSSVQSELNTLNGNDSFKVTVINNYGEISLSEEFSFVNIINNTARPDFSTGHLSRNWNQCILHGMKNVNNPECDVLILAQNDIVFKPGFIVNIKNHLLHFNYITFGDGDALQIMTIESIKRVGMYDERFCNIGFQEADYFLRAVLLNKQGSSINDIFHNRVHNQQFNNIIEEVDSGHKRGDPIHTESVKFHKVSKDMFFYKWMGLLPRTAEGQICDENNYPCENWDEYIKNSPICAKQYIIYPYFECDLPELEKKYINYTKFIS